MLSYSMLCLCYPHLYPEIRLAHRTICTKHLCQVTKCKWWFLCPSRKHLSHIKQQVSCGNSHPNCLSVDGMDCTVASLFKLVKADFFFLMGCLWQLSKQDIGRKEWEICLACTWNHTFIDDYNRYPAMFCCGVSKLEQNVMFMSS